MTQAPNFTLNYVASACWAIIPHSLLFCGHLGLGYSGCKWGRAMGFVMGQGWTEDIMKLNFIYIYLFIYFVG
jgi:hypothetical protein